MPPAPRRGTVGLLSTAGCVALIRAQLSGDSSGAETSNENNEAKNTPDSDPAEDTSTPRDEDMSNGTNGSDNETEYAEAQDPEPELEGPETNESNATEEPTSEDVTLSNTELTTASNTAIATGVATNESDKPVAVDLEFSSSKTASSSAGQRWEERPDYSRRRMEL